MHYDIVALPKDQWKGTAIPMITGSDSYYDFEISPLKVKDARFPLSGNHQIRRLFIRLRNMIFLTDFIRIIGRGRRPTVL